MHGDFMTQAPEFIQPEHIPYRWVHFLTNIPPQNTPVCVNEVCKTRRPTINRASQGLRVTDSPFPNGFMLETPNLKLYCHQCSGERNFSGEIAAEGEISYFYDFNLIYTCNNCKEYIKTYSIRLTCSDNHYFAQKFGEIPHFGEQTPAHLLRIIQKEKDNFLKGKACEDHALGIGAFAYYRRIVENSWKDIIDKTITAVQILSPPDKEEIVEHLNELASENQFSKAVKQFDLPPSLTMNNHNPLLILHKTLSQGIHDSSDEACLAQASSVRTILLEMTARISSIKKEDRALIDAVNSLANPKSP